jgi:hypothetical protein
MNGDYYSVSDKDFGFVRNPIFPKNRISLPSASKSDFSKKSDFFEPIDFRNPIFPKNRISLNRL